MEFLTDYPVVVPATATDAELWVGTQRARRAWRAVRGGAVGAPIVVDHDGEPVVSLAPLVCVAAPTPGAALAMFWLAGPGRTAGRGARGVAAPLGFERHDDAVWAWFRDQLLAGAADDAATTETAPYRGLAAFTERDAAHFVGRKRAAEARRIASFVEQGRRYLLDGDYARALPYLGRAYASGDRSVALRFLLHRAKPRKAF